MFQFAIPRGSGSSTVRAVVFLTMLTILVPGAARAGKLKIVTTLPSLASITKTIGGDRVEVTAICKGYEDPHYIQPKPSYSRRLRKADLLIFSGLELEVGWLPPLLETARNSKLTPGAPGLLEASTAVEHKLEVPTGDVSRSEGDIHPFGNPHFMVDPRNGMAVAALIADRLAELDPEGADAYRSRAETYRGELTKRIAEWESLAAPLRGTPVVAYHKQWEYLTEWLGMETVGYIERKPGIPPTPRHVTDLVRTMNTREVSLILVATFMDEDAAKDIGGKTGARAVVLPAEVGGVDGTDTYVAWIDHVVRELVAE